MPTAIKRPRANNLKELNCQNLILEKKPSVKFKDIIGCNEAKALLRDFSFTLKQEKSHYQNFGCMNPKSILLYGPSGCGKTLLAKAFLYNTNSIFMNIKITDIISKWFSESEKNLRKIFEYANICSKEQNSNILIYFDQFDALFCNSAEFQRDSLSLRLSHVLKEIFTGLECFERIYFMASARDKNSIHPVLKDQDIFTYSVLVPKPDQKYIKEYIELLIKSTESKSNKKNWIQLDLEQISNHYLGSSYYEIRKEFNNILMSKCRQWKNSIYENNRIIRTKDFISN